MTLSQEARSLYAEKNPVTRQVDGPCWGQVFEENHPKVALDRCDFGEEGTELPC